MKKVLALTVLMMSTFSFADTSLQIEWGGKAFLNEIECITSVLDKENTSCEQYNEIMVCTNPFTARLKTGEERNLQIVSEVHVASDSRLWKKLSFGMTDKINVASAKSQARFEVKEMIKELESIKLCDDSSDE